ncbi:hypothetical protein AgCh_038268 [Apium graveolens]
MLDKDIVVIASFQHVSDIFIPILRALVNLRDYVYLTEVESIQLLKNRKSRYEQSISTAKAGAPKPNVNESPKRTFHFGNELASFLEIRDLLEISTIGNIEDEPIHVIWRCWWGEDVGNVFSGEPDCFSAKSWKITV